MPGPDRDLNPDAADLLLTPGGVETAISYARGMTAFLNVQLAALLPNINADLARLMSTVATVPPSKVHIGDLTAIDQHCLTVNYAGELWTRVAGSPVLWSVAMNHKIQFLTPTAGDNTPANFEMMKQVYADQLRTLLFSSQMRFPKINAGQFGTQSAYDAYSEQIIASFPRETMPDGVSKLHGLEVMYTAYFAASSG